MERPVTTRVSFARWLQLVRVGSASVIAMILRIGFLYSIFAGQKPDLHTLVKITDSLARIGYLNGSEAEEDIH